MVKKKKKEGGWGDGAFEICTCVLVMLCSSCSAAFWLDRISVAVKHTAQSKPPAVCPQGKQRAEQFRCRGGGTAQKQHLVRHCVRIIATLLPPLSCQGVGGWSERLSLTLSRMKQFFLFYYYFYSFFKVHACLSARGGKNCTSTRKTASMRNASHLATATSSWFIQFNSLNSILI